MLACKSTYTGVLVRGKAYRIINEYKRQHYAILPMHRHAGHACQAEAACTTVCIPECMSGRQARPMATDTDDGGMGRIGPADGCMDRGGLARAMAWTE